MTELSISAPGLLGPWAPEHSTFVCEDLDVPNLRMLLARGTGDVQTLPSDPELAQAQALSRMLGLPPTEALPSAVMTAVADGLKPRMGSAWIRCDPVHLRAEPHGAQVTIGPRLKLSHNEANALAGAINADIDGDWKIHVATPYRWYIELDQLPQMQTSSPFTLLGPAISPALPRGDEARPWRRWLTEAQMLLFAHSLNVEREEAGLPAINSLWLWGQGRTQKCAAQPNVGLLVTHNDVDHGFAAGVGAWAGVDVVDCAAELGLLDLDAELNGLDHLAVDYPAVVRLAEAGMVEEWREAVAELERAWLAPAVAQLRSGAIRRLTLDCGEHARVTVTRASLAKIWRRARPLSAYVTGPATQQ